MFTAARTGTFLSAPQYPQLDKYGYRCKEEAREKADFAAHTLIQQRQTTCFSGILSFQVFC